MKSYTGNDFLTKKISDIWGCAYYHFILALYCLQGVFDHRMKCWQKWQDAQVMLQKKREAEAKLQLANKPDKLQQAKDEIKEVNWSVNTASVFYLDVF